MYDKKKLIIIRAALIAVGAVLAGIGVWQYFTYYPDVLKKELQIVAIIISSAVVATLLGLSAKPFYRLIAGIVEQFRAVVAQVGGKGIIAVMAGLFAGGMIGFLFDVIVRNGIQIIAVRVLADLLVAVIAAGLCGYGFTQWVSDAPKEQSHSPRGYLLTASCFFDDRVFTVAHTLINAKVSDGAVKALWKFSGGEALDRLKKVTESGKVSVIKCPDDAFDSLEKYVEYEIDTAKKYRLMTVASNNAFGSGGDVLLDAFAAPSPEIIALFENKSSAESAEMQTSASGGNGDDGKIIIDK